jgi:leucyl aminopeptidase
MSHSLPTIRTALGGFHAARADVTLLPITEGHVKAGIGVTGKALAAALTVRVKSADFKGRTDDMLVHHGDKGAVVLVGLGKSPDASAYRRAGARGRREAERLAGRKVGAYIAKLDAETLTAFVEGFLLAGYRFDKYKKEPKPARVQSLQIAAETAPAAAVARTTTEQVSTVVAEVFGARDLVNEPPSVATPTFMATYAEERAAEIPGLECTVWKPKQIEKAGLTGILAVSRGSREEPRFIQLHYKGPGATKHIAIVGKGITFDSGGLSLKPANSMETMKYDMAGAAAVIGAAIAVARLALPVEITAYAPASENLPGGRAQKPGDVIRYMNGKTAEVLNTDAEGRLILADALALASTTNPDAIIDLATLTGAARIALGVQYAAVLGTNQPLIDALLGAGRGAGELLWQLPLAQEYKEDIRSQIADIKNVGAGGAGTITAALFLQEFVDAAIPWAHLDIAGPAFAERDFPTASKGATGYGVRLLVRYLSQLGA